MVKRGTRVFGFHDRSQQNTNANEAERKLITRHTMYNVQHVCSTQSDNAQGAKSRDSPTSVDIDTCKGKIQRTTGRANANFWPTTIQQIQHTTYSQQEAATKLHVASLLPADTTLIVYWYEAVPVQSDTCHGK
jgi:hypothetical protein